MVRKLEGEKVKRVPFMDTAQYEKDLEILGSFCDIISEQEEDHQILMKNQVVTRLVSLIEYNLKSFVAHIIDDMNVSPNNVLQEDSIMIKLDVLENFQSAHFTKGKMIVAHLDYINPGIISRIMSRINNLDYFKWYEELFDVNTFELFNNLYKTRNDVIHNLIDAEKPIAELKRLIKSFRLISYHLMVLTKINLGIFEKKMENSEIFQICETHLNMDQDESKAFLQKFKKVTKNHRQNYIPKKAYSKKKF